jgi:hypothetical protein
MLCREAHLLRLEIVESVLNLSCPRCKQVFLDFNGCFALTCSRCSCGFCAWCLQDCGNDSHQHVRQCPQNLTPDKGYSGNIDVWRSSNNKRIQRMILNKILQVSSPQVKEVILKLISSDLVDLGIQLELSLPGLKMVFALLGLNRGYSPKFQIT